MAPVLLPGLVAACLLLTGAGVQHARRQQEFAALLAAHRVLPRPWTPVLAWAFPPVEMLLGVAGLLVVALVPVSRSGLAVGIAAIAVSALYVVLACYRFVQVLVTPELTCGCFGDARGAGRFGTIATLGLAAWTAVAPSTAIPSSPEEIGVAGIAGGAVAVLVLRLGHDRAAVPGTVRES